MISPWERYQQDLQKSDFSHDLSQEQAVKALQTVFDNIVARSVKEQKWSSALRQSLGFKAQKVKGLYFWGGVGRGKTYLMDTFFDALPLAQKRRL